MSGIPVLRLENVCKVHRRGWLPPRRVFSLHADFAIATASITVVLGANGAGKSSLFDLIAGREKPASGKILCQGQDIHAVRPADRPRMVRYNRQSQYARRPVLRLPIDLARQRAQSSEPSVHLFDEPGGNEWLTRAFFHTALKLRAENHAVLFSMHPGRLTDIALLRGICDRFIFAEGGRYVLFESFAELLAHPPAHRYLAPLTVHPGSDLATGLA